MRLTISGIFINPDSSAFFRAALAFADFNPSSPIRLCFSYVFRGFFYGERNMESMIFKRKDYISWDEYFMGVAHLASFRSKDPNTQVGACIVSDDNKILSIGYNGLPKGCSDDEFPWSREGDELDTKYPFVTHSELNAILNYRGGSLEGSKMYVTLFPCNECAKAIIQAGIRDLIFADNKYDGTPSVEASKRMFNAAGVRYYKYQPTGRKLKIEL